MKRISFLIFICLPWSGWLHAQGISINERFAQLEQRLVRLERLAQSIDPTQLATIRKEMLALRELVLEFSTTLKQADSNSSTKRADQPTEEAILSEVPDISSGSYALRTTRELLCRTRTGVTNGTISAISIEVTDETTRVSLLLTNTRAVDWETQFRIPELYMTDDLGNRYKAMDHDRTHMITVKRNLLTRAAGVAVVQETEEIILLHPNERIRTYLMFPRIDSKARNLQMYWPDCGIIEFEPTLLSQKPSPSVTIRQVR